MKVPVMFNNST